MDNIRFKAYEIINSITEEGAFSGQALDKALLSCKDLTEQDKGFITELVYGTISKLYTIDTIINTYSKIKVERLENIVKGILRLTIYQIKYLDKVPDYAAINEAVEIIKIKNNNAKGFVNGVLRSILRDEKKPSFKSQCEQLSYNYSMPPWITQKFLDQYPKNYRGILTSLSKTKGISIRINKKKIDISKYKKLLDDNNIEYKPSEVINEIINLEKVGYIKNLEGFDKGYFSVQNESAAIISYILNKYDIKNTLDICAAPGGKSAYLAELNDKTNIIACDIHDHRIKLMDDNFKRLGLKNIKTLNNDATILKEEWINTFDSIICDVPCSGFGLLGKKPDIKLNMSEESIHEIIGIQRKILENSAFYLKKDGVLIYSTCTLNKDENEKNVMNFLNKHDDFEIEEVMVSDKGNFINNNGMVTILPNNTLDGFFYTVLRKK